MNLIKTVNVKIVTAFCSFCLFAVVLMSVYISFVLKTTISKPTNTEDLYTQTFLKSPDINVVIVGIAHQLFPVSENIHKDNDIKQLINYEKGTIDGSSTYLGREDYEISVDSADYPIKFYTMPLSEDQYSTFINYHKDHLSDELSFLYISLDELRAPDPYATYMQGWHFFKYSFNEYIAFKDGYACSVPMETEVKNYFHPTRNMLMAATPTIISCAYLKDLKENTSEKVTSFLTNAVSETGIVCTTLPCGEIQEKTMDFSAPDHARDLSYTREEYFLKRNLDTENKKIVNEGLTEIEKITNTFTQAGWKVTAQEILRKEKNKLVQQYIEARNEHFICTVQSSYFRPSIVGMGIDYMGKEDVYITTKSIQVECKESSL